MAQHPLDGWQGPPPELDSPAWDALVRALTEHHGRAICGARKSRHSPRPGFPCEGHVVTQPGMAGKRCRSHGGTQPVGVANSNYVHGQRSRYTLSGKLAAGYADQLADMDYISLRDDLAVNATLMQHELMMICAEPPEPLDPELFDEKDVRERRDAITLFHIQQMQARARYREHLADRNRLSRTEIARVRLAEDTISGQQVRAFGQIVLDAVRRRVLELAQRTGIAYDVALDCVGGVQTDVTLAIEASRRASGANDIPAEFRLAET